MQEIFVVAFHALDGRVDHFDGCAMVFEDAVLDTLDGLFAGLGIADDASLGDVFAARLELGLDEDDGRASPGVAGGIGGAAWIRGECREDSGEDERGGDKGYVHGKEGG